jgi:hypothetical protein
VGAEGCDCDLHAVDVGVHWVRAVRGQQCAEDLAQVGGELGF